MLHIKSSTLHYLVTRVLLAATFLVLGSCATLDDLQGDDQPSDGQRSGTPVTETQPVARAASSQPLTWAADVERRQSIQNWEIRGRLGVQTETSGGSMDIIWKQSGQEYSIRLIAPLGAGNYHIQGDNTFAEIQHPDGYRETLDNVEGAFSSVLNVKLPVSAINDWVRGIPARSMTIDNPRWDGEGHLTNVEQSGWNVEMKKYTGSSIALPHAIYLSRDDNADLDIRLALRQWLVDN